MLSKHQQLIADFHSIPIGHVKKSVPNLFDKENHVLHCKSLELYLRLELKPKKYITC